MTPRNDLPDRRRQQKQEDQPPQLYTPLVWAGGGLLLTVTVWFTGILALFRGIGSLFF
jgi:hypothetical protein